MTKEELQLELKALIVSALGLEDIKPEDKRKALETALTQIKKQFGEGAVMRLGQNNGMHVDAISTGSLSLDLALGIGGLCLLYTSPSPRD